MLNPRSTTLSDLFVVRVQSVPVIPAYPAFLPLAVVSGAGGGGEEGIF